MRTRKAPDHPGEVLLRHQTVLACFGEIALRADDLDDVLAEACRLVGEALGTELAKVVQLEPEERSLLVRAGIGWRPGIVGQHRLSLDDAEAEAYAVSPSEVVVSSDLSRETRFRYPGFLDEHGVGALANVAIPGATGAPPFGLLQVNSRRPRDFSEGDVHFLRSYARLLASAVARLRIFADVSRREAALRASLDRQAAALETGVIGFFSWDLQARLISGDKHFARFFGLDPAAFAAGLPQARVNEHIQIDDRSAVEAVCAAALRSHGDFAKEFRVVHPDGSQRWVMARGHCYEAAGRRPLCYTGTAVDVTAPKMAEAALRRANEALEARVAERTRALTEAVCRLRAEAAERERVQGALRQAHQMETVLAYLPIGAGLVAPSGRIIVGNPEFRRLLPHEIVPSFDAAARGHWLGWHPDGRLLAAADFPAARALRGEVALNVDFLHRPPGADGHWRRISAIPILGEGGMVIAALTVIVDVHQEKLASERQLLLTREVDHRAKNMLAVVQAALRLTQAQDTESFVRAIEGRIAALARAQTLLAADRWAGADLRRIVEGELSEFLGGAGAPRVSVEGPRLVLPPNAAQPFSMAIHELAANAIRHGALSVPTGSLRIAWSFTQDEDVLRLRWAESGGPVPAGPPVRIGFGSRVLAGTLRDQLGGRVEMAWQAPGLACDIAVPLGRLRQGAML